MLGGVFSGVVSCGLSYGKSQGGLGLTFIMVNCWISQQSRSLIIRIGMGLSEDGGQCKSELSDKEGLWTIRDRQSSHLLCTEGKLGNCWWITLSTTYEERNSQESVVGSSPRKGSSTPGPYDVREAPSYLMKMAR